MKSHPDLIATAEGVKQLAETLKSHEIIAFDTEFIRETTFYPIVEIIQVATQDESWLVDAQAFKKGYPHGPPNGSQSSFDPGLRPLLEIFENQQILKIIHAAQGDQECLYTSFGAVASPSLDTAVAASLCGYGDGIGLGKLLKAVLGVEIKKGHARTNWSVRPLPEQLAEYAHADVIHLVEVGRKLLGQLESLGRRQWAIELSAKWEDKALYESDVHEMASKLARGGRLDRKSHSVLLELLRWREERVRQLNLPRRWVADDAVLLDLARVKPKDLAHLSAFRGLNKGEVRHSGEALLALIAKAVSPAAQEERSASSKSGSGRSVDIPTAEESQVLDLLRCYVGILADRHRIAAKHLLTQAQLLPLLRSRIERPEDLANAGLLSGEAARLIGEELIAMIHGRRALSIYGKKIRVVKFPSAEGNEET